VDDKDVENGRLEDGVGCWGFVVFRTGCCGGEEGEASWRKFRAHFEKVAEVSVLHWNSGPLLWPAFRAVFVENKELDRASNAKLRARFRDMRDGGSGERLPNGIRTSCFIVADREVIESETAKNPYVAWYVDDVEASVHILPDDLMVYIRAVDPDYDALPIAGGHNEEGRGKSGIKVTGPESSGATSLLPQSGTSSTMRWLTSEANRLLRCRVCSTVCTASALTPSVVSTPHRPYVCVGAGAQFTPRPGHQRHGSVILRPTEISCILGINYR
jgi:hypothetical protein